MTSDRCFDLPMASSELPAGKKPHLPCFPSEDERRQEAEDRAFFAALWDWAHEDERGE